MEFPVLITVEQETLDYLYGLIYNPLFLIGVVFFVFLIVYLIIKFLEKRGERKKREVERSFEIELKARPRPPPLPEEDLSVGDKLRRREEELKRREEEFKRGKRADLEKKEVELEKREVGGSGKPVEEFTQFPTPSRPSRPVGPSGEPTTSSRLAELERERVRTKEMIELAEERFHSGEMDREKFQSLTSEYYKKLLDIDMKIKELG